MNKLKRSKLKYLHFLKRVRLYSACLNEKWTDLIKEHHVQVLRNTGTPCSCWMCRSARYSKKDRVEEKAEIKSELDKMAS